MTGISPALTHSSLPRFTPGAPSSPVLSNVDEVPVTPIARSTRIHRPGGALSWPIPLDADEQRRLRLITMSHAHHLGDQPLVMQTKGGVLEFLRYRQPLPAEAGNDPAKILEALVNSPQGQLMGKALQQTMQGIDSESSARDYLLAAIIVQMDPESITAPDRRTIAGFDLSSDTHAGHHASTVLAGLAEHLSRTGKTSAALASVGAYLLLAKSAPQFLIKDIPPTVKVGSQAWASLVIAAMTIEAQTPGTVPGMTFAQVMSAADQARAADPALTQTAGAMALLDWGVMNGVLTKRSDDNYATVQFESVRARFNVQLESRRAASNVLDKELPTREGIAREKMIERFGDLGAFFEEKVFSTDQHLGTSEQTGLGGMHSLLDIAMMDWPNPRPFKVDELSSSLKPDDVRKLLTALNAKPQFGVRDEFDERFKRAIEDKKAAVNTTVRHLISQLPLEDRNNFEFGKISFFQEGSYVIGTGFTDRTYGPNKPGLLVKIERDGVAPQAYEINFNQGTIERTALARANTQESRAANRVSTTKAFAPHVAADELGREHAVPDVPINSFDSQRSGWIGDAFVQHLELDDPAIKEQARGQTTLDKLQGGPKPLSDCLLNLIPFRSAIVNFQKGNYGEGAVDLALDIFGFLTAGVATAGKLIKIGRTALTTGAKALRAANVIGVASIEMLNPVSGLGGLARLVGTGGLYLASKGAKAANWLRGATGSYDVLKAVSKHHDAAALGSLKVAGQTVEGGAVLKNGHWYAFDADTMRPYGSPLDEFTVATQAVAGKVDTSHLDEMNELSLELFGHFKVPKSAIAGLTRNSQGVYVAADGHLAHIRHVDSSGETAVYEVRQVTRTEEGVVQARVYHNNRQTELLVQHVQGDQWQRLGAPGGGLITAEHLRAWEALSPTEKANLTRHGFAKKYKLTHKTFEYYVKPDGQLSATGVIVRDRDPDMLFNSLTATHAEEWQNMTQAARDAMTVEGFAGLHNLRVSTTKHDLRLDGTLSSSGQARLSRAQSNSGHVDRRLSREQSDSRHAITDDQLREWEQLFDTPGNTVTRDEFAREHGLSPQSWDVYVQPDGSLTREAERRLRQAELNIGPGYSDGKVTINTLTAEHLRAWEALSREEQLRVTRKGFARQHQLSTQAFEYCVQLDGRLSAIGVSVLNREPGSPFNSITAEHINQWQRMTQTERDALNLTEFARLNHLRPSTVSTYLRIDGSVKISGQRLLNGTIGMRYSAVTNDHLREWKKLVETPGNTVTQEDFLRENCLSPNSWRTLIKVDGSLKSVAVQRLNQDQNISVPPESAHPTLGTSLKRPAQAPSAPLPKRPTHPQPGVEEIPGPSSRDLPVVIKVEPIVPPSLPRHQIDNTLPILQDPDNPRLSLTQALEGPIDDIRIAHWNGLLDGLDSATKQRVSTQIKASIKDWLRTEGQHQPRFDQTLEVVTALDDGGPARGASVWARRDIAQFEVLGPYAGKYHATEASLFQEQRKQGSRAVLTYLFGTRSGNRSVSALHTGNTLSLINTSQLGDGPAWKSNNVISIAVGKNLTFYVALNDIKKGDELLLDYGPLYQPVPDVAIKPEPSH